MNQLLNRTLTLAVVALVVTTSISISAHNCGIPNSSSQAQEVENIESLLKLQDGCWNRGDIEGFMETYWKSEKLTFSGGGKTTRGWQATLDRYKTSYPRDKMGQLHFDGLETTLYSDHVAVVLGKWHLDINGEKKDGNFSLVMKKFDGQWKIVHDHSSTLDKEKGWLSLAQAEQVGKSHLKLDQIRTQKNGRYVLVEPVTNESASPEKKGVFIDRQTAEVLAEKPEELDADQNNK